MQKYGVNQLLIGNLLSEIFDMDITNYFDFL